MHPRLDAQEHIARLRQRRLRRLRHHHAAAPRRKLRDALPRQPEVELLAVREIREERLEIVDIRRVFDQLEGQRRLARLPRRLLHRLRPARMHAKLRQRLEHRLPVGEGGNVRGIERHRNPIRLRIWRVQVQELVLVERAQRFRLDPARFEGWRRPDGDDGFRGVQLGVDDLDEGVDGQQPLIEPHRIFERGKLGRQRLRGFRRLLRVADENVGQSTPRLQRLPAPRYRDLCNF